MMGKRMWNWGCWLWLSIPHWTRCSQISMFKLSAAQVLDFQNQRFSTCWSTSPESGFLDVLNQNQIHPWLMKIKMRKSLHMTLLRPCFCWRSSCTDSREFLDEQYCESSWKQSLWRFLRPSPVKNPWRAEPLWRDCQVATKGRIHSCACLRADSTCMELLCFNWFAAAQLRFCCCLTEGLVTLQWCLACSLSRDRGCWTPKVCLSCCTGTTQLRRCYSNGHTRHRFQRGHRTCHFLLLSILHHHESSSINSFTIHIFRKQYYHIIWLLVSFIEIIEYHIRSHHSSSLIVNHQSLPTEFPSFWSCSCVRKLWIPPDKLQYMWIMNWSMSDKAIQVITVITIQLSLIIVSICV